MLWFPLSLFCALFLSTSDALSKKALKQSNPYIISWVRLGYSVPFLLTILPFISIPHLDFTFWIVILVAFPLEITALILYVRAISVSPLSLTIPFLAFTPVFLILTSFIMLGEFPDRSGMSGILFIAVGVYLLNVHMSKKGILKPFKAVFEERGSILMIIVAFIYSITSNLGKLAIQHSSPVFFGILYFLLLSIISLPVFTIGSKQKASRIFTFKLIFLAIGVFHALVVLTHVWAISLIEVPYMISVKRTSLLFSVIYGWLLFKEVNIKERLLGVSIMLIGLIFITLF
ncbi:MAG: DMT family transporter [Thermodesulfobacteriota bacterium]|nr:DMT family transporter [Thermodesulfobacteriota bacterium]